jgi:hypothetical protein
MTECSLGTEAKDWVHLTVTVSKWLLTLSIREGGSSALNFYTWSKPPAADVDAIEKLGNPGWNFKEYLKYSLMSETYTLVP